MNYYNENKNQLISYFKNASKAKAECLGLELEHFIVTASGESVDYLGENGVLGILNEIKSQFKNLYYVDGVLLGMYNEDYSISLEPSSQFEISVTPQTSVQSIEKIYSRFSALIEPVLSAKGLHTETLGYRPSGSVYDLPLIPKKRYEYMDRFFKTSGRSGINMMRGTASAQVSIDYTDEQDFIKKYRFAYIIMPALKLICDNTPVFENAENKIPLRRTLIWRDTDNSRCEPPSDIFDDSFGFSSYAEYLMNVPLIFIPENDSFKYVGEGTAAQLYSDVVIGRPEIEHIMSMVFPDVRLKSYIEIRGADSLPVDAALGLTAFIKALFYDLQTVEKYLARYNIKRGDIIKSEDNIIQHGKAGIVYDKPADMLINELFEDAENNISSDERNYLLYLKKFYEAHSSRG